MAKAVLSDPSHGRSHRRGPGSRPVDRTAFENIVAGSLADLRRTARQELDERAALGDLDGRTVTAEELVEEALLRTWQRRHGLLPLIDTRTWLFVMLFQAAERAARRQARLDALDTAAMPDASPETGLNEDHETFWEWNQPEVSLRAPGTGIRTSKPSGVTASEIAALAEVVGSSAFHAFALHEIHRLPLRIVAAVLKTTPAETEALLLQARRALHSMTSPSPPRPSNAEQSSPVHSEPNGTARSP